jgi:membrane associated rhomboid family serine protease
LKELMAVWDRDYARADEQQPYDASGIKAPPPWARGLLILHGVAAIFSIAADASILKIPINTLRLDGINDSLIGIVLHPLSGGLFSFLITGYCIWTLGGMVERRLGSTQMMRQYLLGNLLAGVACFIALRASSIAEPAPLMIPAGAITAWCYSAWRHWQQEHANVFGKIMTLGNVIGIAALAFIGLKLFLNGSNAGPWIAGALTGAAGSLLSEWIPIIRIAPSTRLNSHPESAPPPRKPKAKAPPVNSGPDIDAILAKISREGINALSDHEHQQLEAARKARLAAEDRPRQTH